MFAVPHNVWVLHLDLYALRQQDPRSFVAAALPDILRASPDQATELQVWFDAS